MCVGGGGGLKGRDLTGEDRLDSGRLSVCIGGENWRGDT